MRVYLSPHLDDAVLSCGARLWVERMAGLAPRVITICAGIPEGERISPFALYQHERWGLVPRPFLLRRAEDVAALARLDVSDVLHLDVPDAIYRYGEAGSALYASEAGIFGDLAVEEHHLVAAIADQLGPLLPSPPSGEVVAPLGVGHHVDHLLVHAVARRLGAQGHHILYYEELPYALAPGKLAEGLRSETKWHAETLPVDSASMDAKIAAAGYYHSQIPVLFGDDLAMGRALRAYAAAIAPDRSPYGERLWHDRSE